MRFEDIVFLREKNGVRLFNNEKYIDIFRMIFKQTKHNAVSPNLAMIASLVKYAFDKN